jgi:hypothetical protein
MTPMRKEDVVRLFVDLFPGDILSFFLKLSDLFFFRTFCNGFFVAFQAGCYVRQSGKVLRLIIAVARITFQTLLRMFFVIERDGLPGP